MYIYITAHDYACGCIFMVPRCFKSRLSTLHTVNFIDSHLLGIRNPPKIFKIKFQQPSLPKFILGLLYISQCVLLFNKYVTYNVSTGNLLTVVEEAVIN